MMMNFLNKKNSIMLTLLLVFVVVALVTGLTLAYLTDLFESDDDATIGTVSVGFYTGQGVLLSGYLDVNDEYVLGTPVAVTLSSTLNTGVNVDVYIKNTGNIDVLVRTLVAVTIADEESENDGILLTEVELTLTNTGWVNQFLFSSETAGQRTYFFYAYYNDQLAANATAQVIVSLSPKISDLLGETVSIALRADAIAYSANAYLQEDNGASIDDDDKPFGDLSASFLTSWTAWE